MSRLLASGVIIAFAWLTVTVVQGQLPCTSQLRLLPQFAHLFTHCGSSSSSCSYSSWSEWVEVGSPRSVPVSQCASGKAQPEERRQTASGCADKRENRTVCEPDVAHQLILALGLGSSGHHIAAPSAIPPAAVAPDSENRTNPFDRFTRSVCEEAEQVCHDITTPHSRRGRSPLEEIGPHITERRATAEPEPLTVDPIPFDISEHGTRYRRSYRSSCYPNDIQHILFVLDTSTSIGQREFDKVTAALGYLVPLFCKPIKIAVMTFDHKFYVEFCFDCFDNTCGGRVAAGNAISSIPYNRPGNTGIRYTHTGGATQCICDFVLKPTCGLHRRASCIDVVYITDGRSNDPSRDVCKVVKCLHNRRGVNTYAIGIGRAYQPELECIIDDDINQDAFHLFNFDTFTEFEEILYQIIYILTQGTTNPDGDPYVCIDPQQAVGTESCFYVP